MAKLYPAEMHSVEIVDGNLVITLQKVLGDRIEYVRKSTSAKFMDFSFTPLDEFYDVWRDLALKLVPGYSYWGEDEP